MTAKHAEKYMEISWEKYMVTTEIVITYIWWRRARVQANEYTWL